MSKYLKFNSVKSSGFQAKRPAKYSRRLRVNPRAIAWHDNNIPRFGTRIEGFKINGLSPTFKDPRLLTDLSRAIICGGPNGVPSVPIHNDVVFAARLMHGDIEDYDRRINDYDRFGSPTDLEYRTLPNEQIGNRDRQLVSIGQLDAVGRFSGKHLLVRCIVSPDPELFGTEEEAVVYIHKPRLDLPPAMSQIDVAHQIFSTNAVRVARFR